MVDELGYPSLADVRQRVIAAIIALYRYDRELLDKYANERSITHKLAEHLQREFPYWHVDCEYNRRGSDVKRLPSSLLNGKTPTDATEARTVYPDIIVHRRGTRQNLLVIEVKKRSHALEEDEAKIKAFCTDPNGEYRYGLLLTLDPESPTLRRYRPNGDKWDDWSRTLRSALKKLGYGR